jgi:hypothetical protein
MWGVFIIIVKLSGAPCLKCISLGALFCWKLCCGRCLNYRQPVGDRGFTWRTDFLCVRPADNTWRHFTEKKTAERFHSQSFIHYCVMFVARVSETWLVMRPGWVHKTLYLFLKFCWVCLDSLFKCFCSQHHAGYVDTSDSLFEAAVITRTVYSLLGIILTYSAPIMKIQATHGRGPPRGGGMLDWG